MSIDSDWTQLSRCRINQIYYCKGGFHPIHIDDILQDRYHIVNKLGYGSYPTIWLVEDLDSGRYVTGTQSSFCRSLDSEVTIHRHLKQRQINDRGSNRAHQCMFTEVLGPSISADVEEIYGEERYPIEIAKKIVARVMRGVAYLHSSESWR